MNKTLLGSWPRMKLEDFLGFSVASIACIRNGRTARLLGSVCTKVTKEVKVWYQRLWLIRISGFGVLSSVWQDLTMHQCAAVLEYVLPAS
jgi:hypothetical protein